MARGLKHGRTRLIGLIIADITNPYSVNVMSGIEAACREKGFTLLVCIPITSSIRSCTPDLLRSYRGGYCRQRSRYAGGWPEPPAAVGPADGAD